VEKMARATFDKSLAELKDDMLCLGSMAEKAINQSVEALKKRDLALAEQVINNDKAINMKRFETEEKAVNLMATWLF
jgi:phosphate transport system protein